MRMKGCNTGSDRGAYANIMVVSCGWVNFKIDAKTGEKTGNMKIPPAQSLQMATIQLW
jgi:hypothetical protein